MTKAEEFKNKEIAEKCLKSLKEINDLEGKTPLVRELAQDAIIVMLKEQGYTEIASLFNRLCYNGLERWKDK